MRTDNDIILIPGQEVDALTIVMLEQQGRRTPLIPTWLRGQMYGSVLAYCPSYASAEVRRSGPFHYPHPDLDEPMARRTRNCDECEAELEKTPWN
jgi:hypothetical protein